MLRPSYDEQSYTGRQLKSWFADQHAAARLASVTRRLARLETMARDPDYVAKLVASGRDLRLSAAIAWASEFVARAQAIVDATSRFARRGETVLH